MKSVFEYLSTKINKINDYSEFPKTNKFIDVVEFLQYRGYNEIEEFSNDIKDIDELIRFFNKKIKNATNPIYCKQKHDFFDLYIIYCCKDKISEQNSLFVIYCTDNGELLNGWSRYADEYVNSDYYNKIRDKTIYRVEVKKYFELE